MVRKQSWWARAWALVLVVVLAVATLGGCSAGGATDQTAPAQQSATQKTDGDASSQTSSTRQDDSSASVTDVASSPEKQQAPPSSDASPTSATQTLSVAEDGSYTSPEEVALYIHTYGRLPSNYISKTKARKAGWVSTEGNLDEVLPGMSIGGSVYYNEGLDGEELLPEAPGRTWTECDVNYTGGYRGSERLVFSNDGLIFYTADHYKTFTQLY